MALILGAKIQSTCGSWHHLHGLSRIPAKDTRLRQHLDRLRFYLRFHFQVEANPDWFRLQKWIVAVNLNLYKELRNLRALIARTRVRKVKAARTFMTTKIWRTGVWPSIEMLSKLAQIFDRRWSVSNYSRFQYQYFRKKIVT